MDRFFLQRGEDMDRRVAAWVEKPRSLELGVVQIDHYLIFLPGLKISEPGIYERLATRRLWPPPARSFRAMSRTPFGLGYPTRAPLRYR